MRILLIWAALIIAVLYVVVHQFLLQIPANGNWQYNLGMLFQALSLSYIAAFLFYLVHNLYPYLRAKKKYEPVIIKELNDLWEICDSLTYMMSHYSKVTVYISWPYDYKNSVPEQLQNLPVKVNNKETEINSDQEEHILPSDKEFDEKSKPLTIRELKFDKWSEAIEYVSSNINNTLNKVLKLKDVVEEETILKIFDLEKSINEFRIVAKIYEDANKKTFRNGYLEKKFIKFYEGLEELRKYNKKYNDPQKIKN
ncbi:hypothetical protein FPQ02_02295 [Bacillus halotolerans]|uniref:hypothetical protein n=1 Tax=Bacillus halotolerans TaxID=260554 RepID=UPI0027E5B367|nr:hypothetical protein [Bacillus halotolerans]MDQ7723537.1 hypothetical protein [Bacillus halotolerans]